MVWPLSGVILAKFWLKEYGYALKKEIPELTTLANNCKEMCPQCNKKVIYRSKEVECEGCWNWYHVKCGNISDNDYQNLGEIE